MIIRLMPISLNTDVNPLLFLKHFDSFSRELIWSQKVPFVDLGLGWGLVVGLALAKDNIILLLT